MGLHPTLALIKKNLPAVARDLGFQARVTSGYRSRAAQTKLYNRYIQGLQPYPVAPPGTSDHEKGLALDVVSTDTNKLVELLQSVGLKWAGIADPVHFSLVGGLAGPTIEKPSESIGTAYLTEIEAATGRAWDFLKPAPLQVVDFISDPLGTIKKNVSLALDVLGFL
jgi:hypothetical protein